MYVFVCYSSRDLFEGCTLIPVLVPLLMAIPLMIFLWERILSPQENLNKLFSTKNIKEDFYLKAIVQAIYFPELLLKLDYH